MFYVIEYVIWGLFFLCLGFQLRRFCDSNSIQRRRGSVILMVPTVVGAFFGFLCGSTVVGLQIGFIGGVAFLKFLDNAKLGPM